MSGSWKAVTKREPCPSCGGSDWCAWTPEGDVLRCMRAGDVPAGMRKLGADADGGTRYGPMNGHTRLAPARMPRRTTAIPKPVPGKSPAKLDLKAIHATLRSQLTDDRLAELVVTTGVPADAWAKLSPGWCKSSDLRTMRAGGAGWDAEGGGYPDGAFAFPERDGRGRLVGWSLRTVDGRKGASSKAATGGRRGLIVPAGMHELAGASGWPVVLVEGASDVAACVARGIPAVGRPSNTAGASDLAELLDGMNAEGKGVLVVGENDAKDEGGWPGRDGAKRIAAQLAGRWGEPVKWSLPPAGGKDLREWYAANAAGDVGALVSGMVESAREVKPAKRSTADALVELALQTYRLGVSIDREAFAVEHNGPAIALVFRGGASALRAKLAKTYRMATGKTPNASALADALVALEGLAMDAEPEPVSLRLAEHETDRGAGVVLDLGDAAGGAVSIDGDGVTVVNVSPVLFRRTALTGALPTPLVVDDHGQPVGPEALNELRRLLNVGDEAWPLVVGWLVASMLPDVPHPVLMLGGEQGTGKSTAARLIIGLVDPSPALLRSEPRDPESWAMTAAGSWCVVIDNVSRIPGWWSDAICKAVTGDGWVRRKLYTDSDLSVLNFRRCVVLTSIDAGALRGDLGDRLLLVDLERICETHRRTEAELDRLYHNLRPRLLAGLLAAVSRTLAVLPEIQLETMPRMADFARVLAAVDRACPELTGFASGGESGGALALFAGQRERIAEDVIESDAVAVAIVALVDSRGGSWSGTAGDLHAAITPDKPPKGWPKTGRGVIGPLKRITPALRQVGIDVSKPEARTSRGQTYTIERVASEPSQPSQPSPEADHGPQTLIGGDGCPEANPPTVTPTVTPESPLLTPPTGPSDGCDGSDGSMRQTSGDAVNRKRGRI